MCHTSMSSLGVLVLCLVVFLTVESWGVSPLGDSCSEDQLVQYEVQLKTFWDKEKFPKHYPKWRPRAQWTKLIGMSHNEDYVLFREGEKSSKAMKLFTETGKSDDLDAVTYSSQGLSVMDVFYAPAIPEGVGATHARFFADGNHSKISMVAKIVPSPDWFIGVDSMQLCSSGHWINATSIQLSPLDAGTDQGLAFTSPSWESDPLDPIRRISHNSPSHPAASFSYPNKTSLPVLATLSIVKMREYSLLSPSSSSIKINTPSVKTETRSNKIPVVRNNKIPVARSNKIPVARSNKIPVARSNEISVARSNEIPDTRSNKIPAGRPRPYHPVASIIQKDNLTNRVIRVETEELSTVGTPTKASVKMSADQSSHEILQEDTNNHENHLNEIKIPEHDTATRKNDPDMFENALKNNEIISNEVLSKSRSRGLDLPYSKTLSRNKLLKEKAIKNLKKLVEEKRQRLNEKTIKNIKDSKSSRNISDPALEKIRKRLNSMPNIRVIPSGDAMSVIDSIVEAYQKNLRDKRRKQRREERKNRKRVTKLNGLQTKWNNAVDCSVGEWSAWSPCSKTCDIGEQQRKRNIVTHTRRGGQKCPALVETTWCGSARGCKRKRDYFNWTP